jgi:hypothetical protein
MENKDNTVWNNFDDIHPEPNRKIKVDLGGKIFDSETKMMNNLANKITLMANMVQSNGNDWFVGMIWFKMCKCKWIYND